MDNENTRNKFESIFSTKVRAGKRRTYFFDVRKTKGEDYYITLTESTRKFNGDGYERHKIFLYKEDFNRFLQSLTEAIDHVKEELMPDYNYEEFDDKHAEWESQKETAGSSGANHAPAKDEEADILDDTSDLEKDFEDVSTTIDSSNGNPSDSDDESGFEDSAVSSEDEEDLSW